MNTPAKEAFKSLAEKLGQTVEQSLVEMAALDEMGPDALEQVSADKLEMLELWKKLDNIYSEDELVLTQGISFFPG